MPHQSLLHSRIITKSAESAPRWFAKLMDTFPKELEGRTGCYIAAYDLTDPKNPTLIYKFLIGHVEDPEKLEKYRRFSSRKCIDQLGANPTHSSSAQSADEDKEWYAGGVRSHTNLCDRDIAIAVSGLPALADECLAAEVMADCGLLAQPHLEQIWEFSNNPFLERMM